MEICGRSPFLSDCNWTRTQNHVVFKRTLNHLAKRLSVRLRTKWFWVFEFSYSHLTFRFRACFEQGVS